MVSVGSYWLCSSVPFLDWLVWWRAVPGWRCVLGRVRRRRMRVAFRSLAASFCLRVCQLCLFSCVTPHSGAGAHGVARARGEPSDNLCSQCAEDGSPLERAQSEATPPHPGRTPTKTTKTTKATKGHARSTAPRGQRDHCSPRTLSRAGRTPRSSPRR